MMRMERRGRMLAALMVAVLLVLAARWLLG